MSKNQFRKESLSRLRSIPKHRRYIIDKKINSRLYSIIKASSVKSVMLYVPLEIEVDVLPLIRQLRRDGVLVLVPFMEGKSFRLVKYRLPLSKKKYGVKEPKISKQFRKKRVGISVVPIVGTDTSLRRIGFGKGMYDRFFARERKYIDEIIFVQRSLCFSREIVTDHYDVRADRLIIY
jgi:5-formyltetrahydrofolate cyclo-ligase